LLIKVGGRMGGVERGEEIGEKKNPTDRCKIFIPTEITGIII
jgi:hypothetical protein